MTTAALASINDLPPGNPTSSTEPRPAITGKRVPKLISTARTPFRPVSHAVGAVTVAAKPVFGGAIGLSCTSGIHPGYPLASRGVAWRGRTTRAQDPRSARTSTCSPSSACESALPIKPAWSAAVIAASHCRSRTGFARAGASIARGDTGLRHSVATATST